MGKTILVIDLDHLEKLIEDVFSLCDKDGNVKIEELSEVMKQNFKSMAEDTGRIIQELTGVEENGN